MWSTTDFREGSPVTNRTKRLMNLKSLKLQQRFQQRERKVILLGHKTKEASLNNTTNSWMTSRSIRSSTTPQKTNIRKTNCKTLSWSTRIFKIALTSKTRAISRFRIQSVAAEAESNKFSLSYKMRTARSYRAMISLGSTMPTITRSLLLSFLQATMWVLATMKIQPIKKETSLTRHLVELWIRLA